jgi:hypothetical protein
MKSIDICTAHGGKIHVADLGKFDDGAHIALRVTWNQRDAAETYLDDADALILVGAILSMVGAKGSKAASTFKERVEEVHKKRMEGGA